MVTTVNNTSSNPVDITGTSLKSAGQTSADAQQDRFLKLLVAQLNNQDPMNPMDNAQMTSQMAQINTVTGINQLNETMKSMAGQFTAMQVMQGTGMIGHDILLQSNMLSVDGGVANGAVDLAGTADKVSVQILSQGGQLLDTINLGAKAPGLHPFSWDASNYAETASPVFKVVATSGKQGVYSTAMARDTVTAISTEGSTMNLQLKGRPAVTYDAVKAVL
jgi:flagellar basal-body rod modification protein FlgD